MSRPEIGDRVKIVVASLIGIVTARSQHLHGCDRIGVQAEGLDKSGKPHDTYWFDEAAAKVIKKKAVIGDFRAPELKTGGPSLPGQTPVRGNPK